MGMVIILERGFHRYVSLASFGAVLLLSIFWSLHSIPMLNPYLSTAHFDKFQRRLSASMLDDQTSPSEANNAVLQYTPAGSVKIIVQ